MPARTADHACATPAPERGELRAAPCRFSVITTRAKLDALEAQWNALFQRTGRPHQFFQSFNWLSHWADHYLDSGTELAIVTGWRRDRLVMVWPTVAARVAGIRKIAWMGAPVSPYGDALVEDGPDAPDLLRQGWACLLALSPDVVNLRGVRGDAVVAPLLAEMDAMPTASFAAPYLDLASAPDFATYRKRYSAKSMSNRRRHLRRLAEVGSIGFEQHQHGAVARELIDCALMLKRAWLQQHGIISQSLHDPRFDRFFGDIVLGQRRPVGARVSAVRCDAKPVAIEISFACKQQVFGHVIAHDMAFEKQGVGVILADYTIGTAHEQGSATFDLLPPANAYKVDLADHAVTVGDWAVPLSRKGDLYTRLWLCRARHWLKSSFGAMPLGLRRAVLAVYRVSRR
jgi:CelD/BcsL family acetyltransferase involved in cellulose biosynthesis